jgi:hypothetical protein
VEHDSDSEKETDTLKNRKIVLGLGKPETEQKQELKPMKLTKADEEDGWAVVPKDKKRR